VCNNIKRSSRFSDLQGKKKEKNTSDLKVVRNRLDPLTANYRLSDFTTEIFSFECPEDTLDVKKAGDGRRKVIIPQQSG